jgi:RNA polymerase sigma factor (sigma-70 family)
MTASNGATTNGKPAARRRKGREQIKGELLHTDPTRDYHSTRFTYYGELFVTQLPQWRLWTGRMMLTSDPIVNFSLNVRNAALMPAEVIVTAKNPKVQQWVEEQWSFMWNYHRKELTNAKRWGFNPLQVLYKADEGGLLKISGIKEFAPEDCRALEAGGKMVGERVKGQQLFFPQALWLTFGAEFGSPYGTGCLRRSYPAWYEKWMDHGAKRLLQLRMTKDAYIGDIFWYPPNMIVTLPDGTQLPWRDMLRELGENRLSGGALTLPRLLDTNGKELTGYTPPQDVAGGSQIFEWIQHCDENIMYGADVPIEVAKASDTGSGYSGRSIPFLVVLSVCTQELSEIVQCVTEQVLRPVAWLNWGGDVEFEVIPRSLVESFSQDTSGSAMAGSAIGTPASQPQQGGVPVGQPGQASNVQFDEEFEQQHPRQGGKFAAKGSKKGAQASSYSRWLVYTTDGRKVFKAETAEQARRKAKRRGIEVKKVVEAPSSQHEEAISFSSGEERALHAPPKGVTIHGVHYKGGEFIPKEVIAELSEDDRRALRAGSVARHIKDKPELTETKPNPPVSEEKESKANKDLAEAKAGSKEAMDKVFEQYLGLVKHLANKYAKKRDDFDDLVQAGSIAVLKAVEGFDPAKGKFTTYAWQAISREMQDFGTKQKKHKSNQAEDEDEEVEAVDRREEQPGESMDRSERTQWLHKAVDKLEGKHQKEVIKRHLLGGETLEAIAADLGVTKARAWQIETAALEKLRNMPESEQFEELLIQLEEEKHSYSSTQFNLPSDLSWEVWQLGHRIAAEHLIERENQPHVTVLYGLHTDDGDTLEAQVTALAPIAIQLGPCSVFHGQEGKPDVLKIDVISKGLHHLHEELCKHQPHTKTYPDYKPHVTVAYVKPGWGEYYAKRLNDLEGRVAVFDKLIFSNKQREHTKITLTGQAQFVEGDAPCAPFRTVAFEENDAVRKLREFVLKGTNAKLREAVARMRKLKEATALNHGTLAGLLENEVLALQPLLTADLSKAMYSSALQGVAEQVQQLPDQPDSGLLVEIPKLVEAIPELKDAEDVHLPVLDHVIQTLQSKSAATGVNYKETARKVHQGAFAVTADITDKASGQIRDLLAEALQKGTNKDEFIDTVITKLEEGTFSEHHLENVFRTNTAAALSDGQAAALANSLVTDHFPYAAYHATVDGRVRKEHLALEKLGLNGTNIYRQDDPVFKKFRPPWSYQCRCSWHGVTVEQAARRGVQEAVQWLERAKAMAQERGGSFYQYLNATQPATSEYVTPPPFDPSPEFKR